MQIQPGQHNGVTLTRILSSFIQRVQRVLYQTDGKYQTFELFISQQCQMARVLARFQALTLFTWDAFFATIFIQTQTQIQKQFLTKKMVYVYLKFQRIKQIYIRELNKSIIVKQPNSSIVFEQCQKSQNNSLQQNKKIYVCSKCKWIVGLPGSKMFQLACSYQYPAILSYFKLSIICTIEQFYQEMTKGQKIFKKLFSQFMCIKSSLRQFQTSVSHFMYKDLDWELNTYLKQVKKLNFSYNLHQNTRFIANIQKKLQMTCSIYQQKWKNNEEFYNTILQKKQTQRLSLYQKNKNRLKNQYVVLSQFQTKNIHFIILNLKIQNSQFFYYYVENFPKLLVLFKEEQGKKLYQIDSFPSQIQKINFLKDKMGWVQTQRINHSLRNINNIRLIQ